MKIAIADFFAIFFGSFWEASNSFSMCLHPFFWVTIYFFLSLRASRVSYLQSAVFSPRGRPTRSISSFCLLILDAGFSNYVTVEIYWRLVVSQPRCRVARNSVIHLEASKQTDHKFSSPQQPLFSITIK